jgi:hypothetical protein
VAEPARAEPILCSGWRGQTTVTSEATIWIYGTGSVDLDVRVPSGLPVSLWVEGRLADRRVLAPSGFLRADLGQPGWHAILLSAPRAGLKLMRVGPTPAP